MFNRNYGISGAKMSNTHLSTFYSDDQLKTSLIFTRGESGYRVVCLESYFGKENEYYFDTLPEAESFAKDWVL